jgi:hypothetical protein
MDKGALQNLDTQIAADPPPGLGTPWSKIVIAVLH